MRAPISVIIPTLNAAPSMAGCLAALGAGLERGLIAEVIISDGGSQDDIAQVAELAGAVFVTGPSGRGGQLRRGVEAALGDWFLVIHADSWLGDGWADSVLDHIGREPDRAAVFRLAFRSPGVTPQIVAGWANLRSRLFSLPYGDQGLLIPREVYQQIGGYPDIALMEDVAISRALRGRFDLLPVTIHTSAARYERDGWLRRSCINGWHFLRYLFGADPEKLAQSYRRSR